VVDASDYLIDKARDAIGLRSKWFVITRYGGLAFFAFVGVVISAFDDWLTCFACWLVFCFAFFMLIKKLEEHSKWAAEHKRYSTERSRRWYSWYSFGPYSTASSSGRDHLNYNSPGRSCT
jgi:hypothetical protein